MRTQTACLIVLLAAALPAIGVETLPVLKVGNTVYSNVLVLDVTATDIVFKSATGIGNAKLKNLEPDLQKHFHYDAAKAADAERKQAAGQGEYGREMAIQAAARTAASNAAVKAQASAPAVEKPTRLRARSFLNKKAPELVVEKWFTEEPDTQGKCVLIDFWATWCAPCKRSIPELNDVQREFGDKLIVIGMTDDSEALVRNMADPKIEYAIAIDTHHRTYSAVGITAIPHAILMDPQGIVRWEGNPLLSGQALNEKIVPGILAKYSR